MRNWGARIPERKREPCIEPGTNRYHAEWCDPVRCLELCPKHCWCDGRERKLQAMRQAPRKPALSERQRRFAQHYARYQNGWDAARAAGYKDPRSSAERLLLNPAVEREIEAHRKRLEAMG